MDKDILANTHVKVIGFPSQGQSVAFDQELLEDECIVGAFGHDRSKGAVEPFNSQVPELADKHDDTLSRRRKLASG